MQGDLVERPLSHFVGVRVSCPVDELSHRLPEGRNQLLSRQHEVGHVLGQSHLLGVTLPQEEEQAEDRITTYLGFEVAGYAAPPAGFVRVDLLAGRYARFVWQGSLESEEFGAFYPGIFKWLQSHRLAPSATAPWIEVYGDHYDWENRASLDNRLEALIPLAGGAA